MSSSLNDLIKAHIRQHGPMTVQDYWVLCLAHPQHGYYRKQDPFGRQGDFITAPEISQMFGEILGIWAADLWMKLGSPSNFLLAECGAGRGTMLGDLLRATKNVPGFHDAMSVQIVETSETLRKVQADTLADYKVTWHDTIDELPANAPIIFVTNEFLDALPIRQVVRAKGQWFERVIGLQDDKLSFGRGGVVPMSDKVEANDGTIFEFSPARDNIWRQIAERVRTQTGGALTIDYGHAVTGFGNTLQAVKDHAYCDVLETPGDADITSHVDFARLSDLAKDLNPRLATQRDFLTRLGIHIRAKTLLAKANEQQAADIQSALERLTSKEQMGDMFKVLAIVSPSTIDTAGFVDGQA